jgi:uncharacterized membrane protein
MNRFKSPVFWVAIVTNIMLVAKLMGWLELFGITEDSYKEIVLALTSIINAFGIANNPTDKEGF